MKDSTKLNRLLSIFNQKSDVRQKLITSLGEQTGNDLSNEIAGAAMSSWLPQGWVQRFIIGGAGLGALINPKVALAVGGAGLAASPRLIGLGAETAGLLNRSTPFVKQYGLPALLNSLINGKK